MWRGRMQEEPERPRNPNMDVALAGIERFGEVPPRSPFTLSEELVASIEAEARRAIAGEAGAHCLRWVHV